LPAHAGEQTFPARSVRLIVPFTPAGGADTVARFMVAKMSVGLQQQIVIDNRPGASTSIGSDIVAKANPDGYTLLLCALPHATNPALLKKLPYDTLRDFAPITLTARIPSVLLVHAKLPAKTVKELIALAKAKPQGLNYASPGSGTAAHLAMELFKTATGINATAIPYRGAGPQVTALVAGEVDAAFATLSTARSHLGSGRLRSLAVATLKRSYLLPEVPTVAELGYPGFEAYAWFGLLAPAGTPAAIVDRLNNEANAALTHPDVRQAFEADGIEAAPGTPEALARHIRTEMEKWGKLITQAGIKAD
jgi:tripartite-type tricarboxylate transporter receptor subunit TctC